jgi:hypothetical protein
LEAQRRKETRTLLRAVARVGSRGPVRQFAYWSIDAVMDRRREREFAAARTRWESEKIAQVVRRGRQREEQPVGYESFVAERARAGDVGAQRVHADLTQPRRRTTPESAAKSAQQQRAAEPKAQARAWRIDELRIHLDTIRTQQDARYERAKQEREDLQPVDASFPLADVRGREEEIRVEVATRTAFTENERARLLRCVEEQKSWNPLTRNAARKMEEALRAEQRHRHEATLRDALQRFTAEKAPRMGACDAAQQLRYERYIERAYALEEEMSASRIMLRQWVEVAEEKLEIIERVGGTHLAGIGEHPKLEELCEKIDRCFTGIPEETRRLIQERLRDERKQRDRARGSPSI